MDSDARALQTALNTLRQQHGDRLDGALGDTQDTLRRTLQQQMGVDAAAADRLVKKLSEDGQLRFVTEDVDDEDTGVPATGPVIAIPGTTTAQSGEEFVVPAPVTATEVSPGGLSTRHEPAGTGLVVESAAVPNPDSGAARVVPFGGGVMSTPATAEIAPPGTPISPEESARAVAEDREGATMGQLGDTGGPDLPSTPSEALVAEGDLADDAQGYWQIG